MTCQGDLASTVSVIVNSFGRFQSLLIQLHGNREEQGGGHAVHDYASLMSSAEVTQLAEECTL